MEGRIAKCRFEDTANIVRIMEDIVEVCDVRFVLDNFDDVLKISKMNRV